MQQFIAIVVAVETLIKFNLSENASKQIFHPCSFLKFFFTEMIVCRKTIAAIRNGVATVKAGAAVLAGPGLQPEGFFRFRLHREAGLHTHRVLV